MAIYKLILIALVTFGASFIQGVSGFGFGIVSMIFLPRLLMYTEANVLSSLLSCVTSVTMLAVMYRKVTWRNLLFPLAGSSAANYLAIRLVKSAENDVLTLLLGIALFLLSIYFFFFSEKIRIRPSWRAGLIAGVVSGVLSGLFAIGGPPVVIYYMQSEKDTDSYLATISAYFVFNGIISISMKALSGFITRNVLLGAALGLIGMLTGTLLGNRIRCRINPKMLRKAVYSFMAVSGLINVFTVLF